MIKLLKYGNTNTYYIGGDEGLLIDTDYAGTLPAFFREIKEKNIGIKNIKYVIATHYHPDHVGLISELMKLGVKLILITTQESFINYPDEIFSRTPHLKYKSINKNLATLISPKESRAFLKKLDIDGEIFTTASHSDDGIAIVLDSGECFIGDVEPLAYLEAYEEKQSLASDWEKILSFNPKVIYHSHYNEKRLK